MAVGYKQWLKATGRKGTPDDAYKWKTTHGVALGKYNPDGTPYKPVTPQDIPTPPNATRIKQLRDQQDALPTIYNPQRELAREQTKAALAGYGDMFTWQKDNPATPEDESLIPVVKGEGQGTAHRDAYRNVNQGFANHGALYSSYRDRAQDQTRRELNDRARAVYEQYGARLAQIERDRTTEWNQLETDITTLYGQDAIWIQTQAVNQ